MPIIILILVSIYMAVSTVIVTLNWHAGLPMESMNWKCTKSIVTSEELPKKEECIQWTLLEKYNGK